MKTPKQSAVSSSVMEQIKQGKVTMRPRVYYFLLSALSVAAIALSGLIVSYLLGIVFFWLRIQASGSMAWGARANLSELLNSFPWWAVPLTIAIFVAMIWLVRKQGTLYRHKTSTIALALVLLSLIAGIGLSYLGDYNPISGNGRGNPSQSPRGPNWRVQ